MDKIVGVAIKTDDGLICCLPKPNRHHDIIRKMASGGFDIPIKGKQGFITNGGLFVDRFQALSIAFAAKQILPGFEDWPQLYSECLW